MYVSIHTKTHLPTFVYVYIYKCAYAYKLKYMYLDGTRINEKN